MSRYEETFLPRQQRSGTVTKQYMNVLSMTCRFKVLSIVIELKWKRVVRIN